MTHNKIPDRRGGNWLPRWCALLCCLFLLVAALPLAAQEEQDILFAEVTNLNPGANLHIRLTPQIDSLSLRLIPVGTEVELLGMNDARNWAFIHLEDGAGLVLRGWVSADYISFRSGGRYYSLAELERTNLIITVTETLQGGIIEQSDTVASSSENDVAEEDRFYADVDILEPGARLHIRRDPDANSESLALVPAGTALLLNGLQAENEWAFVNYVQDDTSQISGWVSANYVNYRFRDQYYSHTQLLASGRIGVASADARGGLLDASGRPISTVDNTLYTQVIGLDEGTRLHLRRLPDSNSESLTLAPNGTQFSLNGFSADGGWAFVDWAQAEGKNYSGWVSSTFLLFQRRGLVYTVEQLLDSGLAVVIAEGTFGRFSDSEGIVENVFDDTVYAVVAGLVPGARLHIRIAPDANSESLALVSAGTSLILNGLQAENEWAFVNYVQDDTSQISGWVSANYVNYSFRDQNYSHTQLLANERIREASADERGGLLATSERPINTVDNTLNTQVNGLAGGARLHLRRFPDASSESLTLAANGTQFSLNGFSVDGGWAFVEWTQADGSIYSGWVSSTFLLFQRRGLVYTVEQLLDSGLAEVIAEGTFGRFTAAASSAVAGGTVANVAVATSNDTVYAIVAGLVPGARLHIRTAPDANSESLALVSADTPLILNGLQAENEWAFVVYVQDEASQISGWVSANYVNFHFRDQFYSHTQLLAIGRIGEASADERGALLDASGRPINTVYNTLNTRVNGLAGGARLHLRRLPDASSLSLTLAPNGTQFSLNGFSVDGEWAFVDWAQADGKNYSGWVSSTFLLFQRRGLIHTVEQLLDSGLAEVIAEDTFGRFTDPESIVENVYDDTVYAIVAGLVPGANLHIRIAPDARSESLLLVPGGTSLVLDGLNPANSWAYIRHEEQSANVIGWVSTNYLEYRYHGRPYNAERLLNAGYIRSVPDGERGLISAEVSEPPAEPRPARLSPPASTPADAATAANSNSNVASSTRASTDSAAAGSAAAGSTNQPGSATIVNLPPTSRLAIQNAPRADAATLSLQSPGTELRLFGFNSDLTWSYLRYTQADGTTISGWAPLTNLAIRHPASPATIPIFLLGDGLLNLVNDATPGSVIAGNSGANLFPAAALIEAESASGAALTLFESPGTGASSLAQAVAGARLTVLGLNQQLGWAFAQYDEPSGRNVHGWLPLAELRLYVDSVILATGTYEAAQKQYLIPLVGAELRGAASP